MKFPYSLVFCCLLFQLTSSCDDTQEQKESQTVLKNIFIGTYTRTEGHVDGKANGIYRLVLDQQGTVKEISQAAQLVNPSFVSIDPQSRFLYAVSETGADDGEEGSLFSYSISTEGNLDQIDSVGTGGYYPCHVTTNRTGELVLASNYVGGAVNLYRSKEGKLSLLQKLEFEGSGSHWRQDASHTHMTILSPDEEYLYVVDLGSNAIWNFRWDESSELFIENDLQIKLELNEGDGPRHMEFHPEGKLAAVISELSNTISLLSFSSETGVLEIIETVETISDIDSTRANATADIHFHPNGRFLYGSNRGQNTVSVFELRDNSKLELIQEISTEGEIPRNFAISDDGKVLWAANQNSDNICVYDVNPETGKLTFKSQIQEVMTPVCIAGL